MPSTAEMIKEIELLLHRIKDIDDRSRGRHRAGDLRIAVTGLPGNILHTYLLYVAMSDSTIGRKDWWARTYSDAARPHERDHQAIRQLETLTKHSVFVFFLSRIEWNMRKLVTYLEPEACNGGQSPFKNIYGWLLKRLYLMKFVPLYDLCRHVRNSVHTNGRFVPRSSGDITISWDGEDYHFRNMEPIDFVSHEVLFKLYHGLVNSLDDMLNAEAITTPEFIEDMIHT